jgi:hypothetical protein
VVLVGLLQFMFLFFYLDWSRSIEFAMLVGPEVDLCWKLQHNVPSPTFTNMYKEEHINFVVGAGPWFGCDRSCFFCFF